MVEDARCRMRSLSGARCLQLREGSSGKASSNGETSARMYRFTLHDVYVFLVTLERWSKFQRDRDTVQRTSRMRRERGSAFNCLSKDLLLQLLLRC